MSRIRRVVDCYGGFFTAYLERVSGSATSPLPPGPLPVLDIAMWDLAAVRVGVPLWQLLGAAKPDLPAYASLPFTDDPASYLELVTQVCAAHFNAAKLRSAAFLRWQFRASRGSSASTIRSSSTPRAGPGRTMRRAQVSGWIRM